MYSLRISKHSWRALVGSNSKTLNKEKLSHPLKKRDISFQRIHFFYYICISLLKIEDLGIIQVQEIPNFETTIG